MVNTYGYSGVNEVLRKYYNDLESGSVEETLYPGLSHSESYLRWGFIRKVYGILSAQLFLTTLISAFVVLNPPVNDFLSGSIWILICLCIIPLLLIWPLFKYHQKHPLNLMLLALFTISLSFTIGVSCAMTEGRIVLEALILTLSVVGSLTAYTFWAAKRGHDFSFLGPFLFTSLTILCVTSFIQIFFPLGPISNAIYGGISALVFCGYIVYDTDNLIKRYNYDEYILASAALYLDILNIFLSILRVLKGSSSS